MKNLIFYGAIFLVIGLVSCDKVDTPLQTDRGDLPFTGRNVLIEDYTGHFCGNCPPAAIVAKDLSEKYEGHVVVVAVHAGFFAKLYQPDYTTSFTCTAGNDWDGTSGFGVSTAGNPNGLINRKNYNGGGIIKPYSAWSSTVYKALYDTYILGLDLKTTYSTSSKIVKTTIKAKFKTAYERNVRISLVLIEDSIIAEQKDYGQKPDLVPNYTFMHILRAGINGSWGTTLKNAPIAANDSLVLPDFDYTIDDTKLKPKNLFVVAFAYDETNREVLQVEKVNILNLK